MLLAMKDEPGSNLNDEETDFMLDNNYEDDSLEELNAAVIMMARIQPTKDKANVELTDDANTLDYPIWQVIQNGNGPVYVRTDTNGMIKGLPPKTAKEVVAREREIKARTTLLMALPEDHLEKFHKMADAKEMWEAIKSRFKGLHKGYDRFQTFLSQLEIHSASVTHEDANQMFLRSLPSSWSQVALIMWTKPGLDTLSDDLYNNLRVFKRDVKGTTASSSSNTQDVAFVSADNTSSTNDVSTTYNVSSPSVSKSQKEGSPSYTDEVIHYFFANQSRYFARDCREKWNQDSRRRDGGYNGNKARDNSKRHAYQDDSKALVTIDKEAIDWSGHVEEDTQNFAMMAYSSSNSVSDNKEPMEDQPLFADASPTALSPGYVVDSDPEKDGKDPKEDPADYPADRGNNDNDESSNDEEDDDDVEKD
nr:xylulose kinase-1 [Tanacetum cinerariifolium]